MTHYLLYQLSLFLILQSEHPLEGKWKMYRNESMENILTSERFQNEDVQVKQNLAETFSNVLNGTFYHFRKDTVVFTDFKNHEIIELKGIWWTEADTLIVGQLGKISVQKYLITDLSETDLHLKMINPRDGIVFKSRMMFKRESNN